MAYNIRHKLRNNIHAVRIALAWRKDSTITLSAEDIALLKSYSGFGGIKAILLPATTKEDWQANGATANDLPLFDDVLSFHKLLRENFEEGHYKEIISSLKNSVLTAFYTPEVIPDTLYKVMQENAIAPRYIYEPSSGSGIFLTSAISNFNDISQITAVEKDFLTGYVLQALSSTFEAPAKVLIGGFENTSVQENGRSDLIISNIPFGNFSVYDTAYQDKALTGKIHNYFFVKGLDKVANGGLLAYLATDAFLNNPSNKAAREYLFHHADFISLAVMPDNLMKDTGNTEAPSHLLIVQKNELKQGLTGDESLLINTIEQQNEFGNYSINQYASHHPEIITGNEIGAGKNQYGAAHQRIWQNGGINDIAPALQGILADDFAARFSKAQFQNAQLSIGLEMNGRNKVFTFLAVPEQKEDAGGKGQMQLGLFDIAPAQQNNKATAYLNAKDEQTISKQTARIVSTIRTSRNPSHDSILLIAAQSGNRYLYKLYSNVQEIRFPNNWMTGIQLGPALEGLSARLKQFAYQYNYEGDKTLQDKFGLQQSKMQEIPVSKPWYKEGMLALHNGTLGRISNINKEAGYAGFEVLENLNNRLPYYWSYIALRDTYLELSTEVNGNQSGLRSLLHRQYNSFTEEHGLLNHPVNKRQLFEDRAYGALITASLERRANGNYVKSDVLLESLEKKAEHFKSDDPVEALAQCH